MQSLLVCALGESEGHLSNSEKVSKSERMGLMNWSTKRFSGSIPGTNAESGSR